VNEDSIIKSKCQEGVTVCGGRVLIVFFFYFFFVLIMGKDIYPMVGNRCRVAT